MRHRIYWVVLLGVVTSVLSTERASAESDQKRKIYLGAGLLAFDIGRLSNSPIGKTSYFNALFVQIAITGRFFFNSDWGFSPMINYTPFGHNSPEGGEKTTLLAITTRLFKQIDWLDLRLGPGILFHMISANGGTVDLNNGSGTATFGIPSTPSTARMFFWNAGVGAEFLNVRLDLDIFVTGTFSSRRAVDALATVSYGLL